MPARRRGAGVAGGGVSAGRCGLRREGAGRRGSSCRCTALRNQGALADVCRSGVFPEARISSCLRMIWCRRSQSGHSSSASIAGSAGEAGWAVTGCSRPAGEGSGWSGGAVLRCTGDGVGWGRGTGAVGAGGVAAGGEGSGGDWATGNCAGCNCDGGDDDGGTCCGCICWGIRCTGRSAAATACSMAGRVGDSGAEKGGGGAGWGTIKARATGPAGVIPEWTADPAGKPDGEPAGSVIRRKRTATLVWRRTRWRRRFRPSPFILSFLSQASVQMTST